MTSILDFLLSKELINQERREEIQKILLGTESEDQISKTHPHINLLEKLANFPKNSFNYKLMNLILKKKTNLCLAVDNMNKEQILKVLIFLF